MSTMNPPDEAPTPQSAAAASGKGTVILQYSRRRHVSGCPKPHPPITAVFSRNRKKTVPIAVSSPEILRKTRDLPNLSECHACGVRIDLSDGKNRLQTLYSEWRVVLLCGKCLSRVESSVICSYCFEEVSEEGFSCSCCKRRIHRNCFLDCKDVSPWSFSCSGSESSVCIDCWVPKYILKNRVKRKRNVKKRVEVVCGLPSTEYLDIRDHTKILENIEWGLNRISGSRIEVAREDKHEAVREDIVASNYAQLASTPLDARIAGGSESSADRCKETIEDDRVVDDVELAFQLHRSMNSSPRISKKLRPDKLCYMVFRRSAKHNGRVSHRQWEAGNASDGQKHQVCINDETCENQDKDSTGNFPCLKTSLNISSVDLHLSKVEDVAHRGSGLENGVCQVKCDNEHHMMELPMNEGEGSCSNGIGTEPKNCCPQDESFKPSSEDHIGKPDRFLKKYCKKRLSSNGNLTTDILCNGIHL